MHAHRQIRMPSDHAAVTVRIGEAVGRSASHRPAAGRRLRDRSLCTRRRPRLCTGTPNADNDRNHSRRQLGRDLKSHPSSDDQQPHGSSILAKTKRDPPLTPSPRTVRQDPIWSVEQISRRVQPYVFTPPHERHRYSSEPMTALTMASSDAKLVSLGVVRDDMPQDIAVPLLADRRRAGGNQLGYFLPDEAVALGHVPGAPDRLPGYRYAYGSCRTCPRGHIGTIGYLLRSA
ncbi:MAG: hypothetical protein QOE61_524 [Micromonosporaceae bacterium]|nr:hypothetical protein [Micromonosporaceae bacterium]